MFQSIVIDCSNVYSCEQLLIEIIRRRNCQMISCSMNEQIPFVTAFVVTSFSPTLNQLDTHDEIQDHPYVTDLFITDKPNQQTMKFQKTYSIGQQLFLCISHNKNKLPISKISNTLEDVQSWQQIQIIVQSKGMEAPALAIQRSESKIDIKVVCQIQVFEQSKINKNLLQNLQTDDSNSNQDVQMIEFAVENKNFYMFIHKKSLNLENNSDKTQIRISPQSILLYSISQEQIDLNSFSSLSFPNGIQIFRKEGGFKTFNLTLLNSRVQRIYCNVLQFRQKLSPQITQTISKKHEMSKTDSLYAQKSLTMISRYSCTDQVTHCLHHLYRFYLSNPQESFFNQIKSLHQNFTINEKTKKASFKSKGYEIGFKINSSYPQTSIDAIYAVFKFLQIQKIIQIFQAILLEQKIFFISKCQNILGFMIEAFQSFIYPLIWVHSIIPQLTFEIAGHMEAPMPVIFGLSSQLAERIINFETKQKIQGVYVYIDQNQVINHVKNKKKLRPNLRELLIKRLYQFSVYDRYDINDYLRNTENMSMFKTQKEEDPNFDSYKIRNIFFELLVFLLKDYRCYLVQDFQKQTPHSHLSFKKYYDLTLLLAHTKKQKDQFLLQLFQTTLFAQFIDTKLNEPKNKWVRTLDKAIKKIKQYQKQFIQEESDNQQSDCYEQQDYDQKIPRGCLNMIHLFSKQSEDKQKSNTYSPRKSKSPVLKIREAERKSLQSTKTEQNNDSLDRKDSLSTNPKHSFSNSDGIPELDQNNHEKVVYTYDVNDPEEQQENGGFCFYFSYPYKKVKRSTAAQWTKNQVIKFRKWVKNHRNLSQGEQKQKQTNNSKTINKATKSHQNNNNKYKIQEKE